MTHHRNKVRATIPQDGASVPDKKKVRRAIGAQIKMDMSAYVEAYPGKKLMLINDLDGDVQRWLDAGAEPIPSSLAGRKIYKGLNDTSDNEWVKFVAGENSGKPYYAYGLMMDPEDYDAYKLAPQRQRQHDIKAAMERGRSTDSPDGLGGGGEIHSYAPNLPTGDGQGYNEIRSKQ